MDPINFTQPVKSYSLSTVYMYHLRIPALRHGSLQIMYAIILCLRNLDSHCIRLRDISNVDFFYKEGSILIVPKRSDLK